MKRLLTTFFLSVMSVNMAIGQVYMCKDASGNMTFSDTVCPKNTTEKHSADFRTGVTQYTPSASNNSENGNAAVKSSRKGSDKGPRAASLQ